MNILFDFQQEKKLTVEEKIDIHDFLLKEPIKTVKAGFIKAENKKKPKK
jgi:hypothetical protein